MCSSERADTGPEHTESRRKLRQLFGKRGTHGGWPTYPLLIFTGLATPAWFAKTPAPEKDSPAREHRQFPSGRGFGGLGQQHTGAAGLLGHLPVVEGIPHKKDPIQRHTLLPEVTLGNASLAVRIDVGEPQDSLQIFPDSQGVHLPVQGGLGRRGNHKLPDPLLLYRLQRFSALGKQAARRGKLGVQFRPLHRQICKGLPLQIQTRRFIIVPHRKRKDLLIPFFRQQGQFPTLQHDIHNSSAGAHVVQQRPVPIPHKIRKHRNCPPPKQKHFPDKGMPLPFP